MKIFRLVVASLFLAALMISSSVSAEGRYKIVGNKKVDCWYFNGDKNYIYCGYTQGVGYFVDRSTLKVEKYEPPIYVIAVNVVSVGNYFNPSGDQEMNWHHTERFKYDYANRKMYIHAPKGVQGYKSRYENHYKVMKIQPDTTINWSGDWAYIDPHVYYGGGAQPFQVGEIAFALAYKLKFYGLKGYNGSDFYDAVRGVVGEVKDSI